jgi:signal transduction histidine kinase
MVLAGSKTCRLYRTRDWTHVWTKPGDPLSLSLSGAAAFSPDGSRLTFARSSIVAALVETETGRELSVLESPSASPLNTMRWTPDGKRIVVGTRANSLDVWQPDVLERELVALGLGWKSSAPERVGHPRPMPEASTDLTRWIALSLFIVGGVVAVVVLLSLQRHRRLIQDFSRSEAQAQQWERELQVEREVGRLKSGFVSMVTHEFRTPLGIIQSSAQILERYLDRLPPEDRLEQTRSITKNVRRMSHLIDEVLVLGQAEAGQMRFEPAPLDLTGFARRLTDEMISATGSACPIELTLGELPEAVGDENLLRHILSNLISNAVKYSPEGRTVIWGIQAIGRMAVFTVRDEGRGIPAADQAKLFTAFNRGSNVGEVRGTGLGLKIVEQCVGLHGGRIRFESEEGRGTTFIVHIPLFRG